MLTKNFHQLQTEVQRHVAADRVAQGSYKTCFIGCLAKQRDSPYFIEREYGIPLAVSRIAESIFEGLPSDEAPLFFAAFPDAVESDGKDLSRVVWQFLAAELRSLPPVTPEVQTVINSVIDGIDLLAQGKEWPEEDVWAAVDAARAAARAAASDAESDDWTDANAANSAGAAALGATDAADWAAADAASAAAAAAAVAAVRFTYGFQQSDVGFVAAVAARRRQRDLLLTLIKEAPITQQEYNS